jgi:alkaline phosphatase D
MRLLSFTLIFCFFVSNLWGQTITHGPVLGGVTHNSARIWLRTSQATNLEVRVQENGQGMPLSISNATKVENDNSTIIDIPGLQPNQTYTYQILINGNSSEVFTFKTFPLPGAVSDFSFVFGSCQQYGAAPIAEPIFTTIEPHKPLFLLQLGDFGYPDYTDNYPSDSDFFALDYNRVVESYKVKYSGAEIKKLLGNVPFSYVYDDHDFMNDNSSGSTCSFLRGDRFLEVGFPPYARRNSIDAYTKFFPHYTLPDTAQGIYHKITCGNVDIFFIDNRSNRSPNHNALKKEGDKFIYAPPPGHTMLGQKQKQWLLEGLKNSTAKWKFIVGGVSFNKGYRRLVKEFTENDALLRQLRILPPQLLQQIPGGGVNGLLSATVDTWAGFVEEQDQIFDYIRANNIQNVIFLSGDSHTSAIDDGTNAGIPELMSGNLSHPNSRLASFMANAKTLPFVGNLIKEDLNIWNYGGQGIGNQNYEFAFGKIEIFRNDSCRLSVIDVNNKVVTSLTLCSDGKPCKTTSRDKGWEKTAYPLEVYPSPAQNKITIANPKSAQIPKDGRLTILDLNGKLLADISAQELILRGAQEVDIEHLTPGAYFMIFVAQGIWQSFLFQKR